jgi:arginine decarboxylase
LVVEAFGSIEKDHASTSVVASPADHKLVGDMFEIRSTLSEKRRQENLHEAQQLRDQGQSMFELGLLDLRSKAKIDALYWEIATKVVELYQGVTYVPEEVKELEVSLADQLICNFSVFQSLIDHWALGQLFPIMPIHRLHEKAECSGTLVDITCDSDGKIAKFIDFQDVRSTLPLHELRPNEPYYLGFFLTGAYEDVMGDLHNLFGSIHEMHIFLDEDEEDGYYIEEVIPGDTVGSVLTHVQWDTKEMVRRMKTQLDAAIKSDRLKPNEGMRLLNDYEKALHSYTYLKFS